MKSFTEDRGVTDLFGRPLRNLRVSVTDRCNLRCQYCMPQDEYLWLPRVDLLSFEEINELVTIFTELGVDKVRLTGGEPLLRRDLPTLVRMLAGNPRLKDLAMTTNGLLLAENVPALYEAGLHRVTVSLDTLKPDRFKALTRRDGHEKVLEGIDVARKVGFKGTKIDTVVIRGVNEDELVDLLEYGKRVNAEVRFIEYMDVGGATKWSPDKVFSRLDMLKALKQEYGSVEPVMNEGSAPAQQYMLPDGAVFGVIASTTTPFCRTCDRSRLTADGMWYLCLYAQSGIDLRQRLRSGRSREEIINLLSSGWKERRDRGAEQRKEIRSRGIFAEVEELRKDPHLEMHTRGG